MAYLSKKQIWRRILKRQGRTCTSPAAQGTYHKSIFYAFPENQDEQISTSHWPTGKASRLIPQHSSFKVKAAAVSPLPRRVKFSETVRVIVIPSFRDFENELPGSIKEIWWSRDDYKQFELFVQNHCEKFESLFTADVEEEN